IDAFALQFDLPLFFVNAFGRTSSAVKEQRQRTPGPGKGQVLFELALLSREDKRYPLVDSHRGRFLGIGIRSVDTADFLAVSEQRQPSPLVAPLIPWL